MSRRPQIKIVNKLKVKLSCALAILQAFVEKMFFLSKPLKNLLSLVLNAWYTKTVNLNFVKQQSVTSAKSVKS